MKKIHPIISLLFLFIGIMLALTLALLATWANFEANFYGFSKQTKNLFSGLACPVMMTTTEHSEIRLTITNSSGSDLKPNIRTEISSPLTPVSTLEFVELAPGESVSLVRYLSPKNIDLDRFIFVKVLVYAAYPMPDQENTCGIYILPFPGRGMAYFVTGALLAVLFSVGGFYALWSRGEQYHRKLAPLGVIVILSLLALLFGAFGWWVPAIFTIVILLLTMVVALGNIAMQ